MIPFCLASLRLKEHPHPSPLPSRERGWSIAERGKDHQIMAGVKYGISLSNRSVVSGGTSVSELVDAAVAAEESGCFDGVWVGDNLAFQAEARLPGPPLGHSRTYQLCKARHYMPGQFPTPQPDTTGDPVGEPGCAVGGQDDTGCLKRRRRPGTGRNTLKS